MLQAKLTTACYAVDTWRGDPQSGQYGSEVLEEFRSFHDDRFGAFSTLLQCAFSEALPYFDDGSVDFLHIDGLHTYEAVYQDFEEWFPKLSSRAIVLFHDINVRRSDFGVWRLWGELRSRFPSFEFVHGHGLGVLAIGSDIPDPVAGLCELADPRAVAMVRGRFSRIGERWHIDTSQRLLAQKFGYYLSLEERLREEQARHESDAEQMRREVAQYKAEVERLGVELLRHHNEAERRCDEVAHLNCSIRELRAELLERGTELEVARLAAAKASAEIESAFERASQAELQVLNLRDTAKRSEEQLAKEKAECRYAATEVSRLAVALAQSQGQLADVLDSTAWRATWPFRALGERLPLRVRRAIRAGSQIAWWMLTMQLASRARSRRHQKLSLESGKMAPIATVVRGGKSARELPTAQPNEHQSGQPVVKAAAVKSKAHQGPRWVYLSGEPDTPGHDYRVLRPITAAHSVGIQAGWMGPAEVSERRAEIASADALIIWRGAWDEHIADALDIARRNGVKIIFDLDDLMIRPDLAHVEIIDGIRTNKLPLDVVRDHFARMRRTISFSDLCLATTEELAEHMRSLLKPTIVLPNGVDYNVIATSRLARRRRALAPDDGLIRIGYAGGTRTHQRDFAVCAEAVAAVLRARRQTRLVVYKSVSANVPCIDLDEFPSLSGLENQIEWRDCVPLERLPDELARFDVNLAPLEVGNPFCEAKSELKFFEAALAGVPTIASPTGPFRRSILSGTNGFLAGTLVEWETALLQLVDNPAMRQRLSHVGAREVLWRFGPERRAEQIRAISDILNGGRAAIDGLLREMRCPNERPPEPRISDTEIVFQADRLQVAEVSIVVPLYNYAQFIVEALESVGAQTLRPLDLIVVDDKSADGSLAVALDWIEGNAWRFNRVLLLRNRTNSGLAATRNAGFDAADTRYVMPLDADNRLLPQCAAACLRVAQESGAALAYPIIRKFGSGGGLIGNIPFDPIRLQLGNYIDAMALISKAAWVAVGGYNRGGGGWEDFDFLCRLVEHGFVCEQVPDGPHAEYRVHANSMMNVSLSQPKMIRQLMDEATEAHPWLRLVVPTSGPNDQKV